MDFNKLKYLHIYTHISLIYVYVSTLTTPNTFFVLYYIISQVCLLSFSMSSQDQWAPQCFLSASSVEYPAEAKRGNEDEQSASGFDPYAPAATVVTMITEETYPYATAVESFDYAKEDKTLITQVPYGGDAELGQEGPTECDCEAGEPGFGGFAGPKVGYCLAMPCLWIM